MAWQHNELKIFINTLSPASVCTVYVKKTRIETVSYLFNKQPEFTALQAHNASFLKTLKN